MTRRELKWMEVLTFEEWVHRMGLLIGRLTEEKLDELGRQYEAWLDTLN